MTEGMTVALDKVCFSYSAEEGAEEAEGEVSTGHASRTGGEAQAEGETGVSDVSLRIASGECVVLCGRSGSGKSTILRLISGLAPGVYEGRLSGDIRVAGRPLATFSAEERVRLIGVVLQDPRSQFFMSEVADELAFSAENLGIPPSDIRRSIASVADMFGIGELLGSRIDTLSSGQRQRVALAAAMLLSPGLLLLDEPAANLDSRGAAELVEVLRTLKAHGTTVVISEHRTHGFLGVADRYVRIEQGTVRDIWDAQSFSRLSDATLASLGMRAAPGKAAAVNGPDGRPGSMAAPADGADRSAEKAPALTVRNVGYRYQASSGGVFDFTADFPIGQVTGLFGDNGAGKTTLGRILCGMLREERGEILLDGAFLSQAERRQASHFVMQDADYQLYADSVGNELLLGCKATPELKSRALEALDAFGLAGLRDRHPASLSGGEKQRLTLAVAYCADARLVILDEPTSGLDGDGVAQVAAWTRKLARAGKCVVVVTHDRELAALCCDSVVCLRGRRHSGAQRQKGGIPRLLDLAAQRRAPLVWSAALSVVGALLSMLPLYAVYQVLDALLLHAGDPAGLDGAGMLRWTAVGLAAMLAGYGFSYAGGMCAHTAAFKLLYDIRMKLAEHMGRLPLGFFDRNASGKIKKVVDLDVDAVEAFVAHQLPDMAGAAAVLVATAAAMLYLNPYLALAALLPIAAGLFAQYRLMMGSEARREMLRYFDALEEIGASSSQYVRGMTAVKVFGQTVFSFRRFHADMLRYRDSCISYTDRNQNGYVAYKVLTLSLACFVLPVGVLLLAREPGDTALASVLMLFLVLAPGLSVSLFKLISLAGGMTLAVESVRRIDDILAEEPLPEVAEAGTTKGGAHASNRHIPDGYDIRFEDVSFSYAADGEGPAVLRSIGFTARQGEVTALVGPSGSGKSTIAQLLCRFWDVGGGRITIGGVDIRELPAQTLMDSVSFVFQDAFLFSDTVYGNIAMGNPKATRENVRAAARAACCHEAVMALPDAYDTRIGEGGVYLSGGEGQRVCVARAILKDAPVLVLDEATAYADPENEHLMQQALSVLMRGKTVIVIAHRLPTIRNAHRILVLQDGAIVESGLHDGLLKEQGLYARMWDACQDASSWVLTRKGAGAC